MGARRRRVWVAIWTSSPFMVRMWARLRVVWFAFWTVSPAITRSAVQGGRLSELTPRAVRHLVADGDSRSSHRVVILEIGAHDGGTSDGFLREFGPNLMLHAFEPEPRAIRRFLSRGLDERARLHQVALGRADGVATFYRSGGAVSHDRPDGWDLSGSIRKPRRHLEVHPWVTFTQTLTVPVRSLDSWGDEVGLGRVDFIWMDVQGAEADVIRGAPRVLARTRLLYTEYSNHELYEGQATLDQLIEALTGWRLVAQLPNDALFENLRFSEPAQR